MAKRKHCILSWLHSAWNPETQILNWCKPVRSSYITHISNQIQYIPWDCIVLGNSLLFYMCSQLAQPAFKGWDFQPDHCLKVGIWRWLSKWNIPHDFRSQQWSEAEPCTLAVPEEIQSKQSKQARPCWDQQSEAAALSLTAHLIRGHLGTSWKEREGGERLLSCFCLSHEKSSTLISFPRFKTLT